MSCTTVKILISINKKKKQVNISIVDRWKTKQNENLLYKSIYTQIYQRLLIQIKFQEIINKNSESS